MTILLLNNAKISLKIFIATWIFSERRIGVMSALVRFLIFLWNLKNFLLIQKKLFLRFFDNLKFRMRIPNKIEQNAKRTFLHACFQRFPDILQKLINDLFVPHTKWLSKKSTKLSLFTLISEKKNNLVDEFYRHLI